MEFKYYADGIHSGLTAPGNNSRTAGLTKAELSPSVCAPLSPSLFAPHQILYRVSLSRRKKCFKCVIIHNISAHLCILYVLIMYRNSVYGF